MRVSEKQGTRRVWARRHRSRCRERGWRGLAAFAFLCLLPALALAEPVELRAGRHEDFGRIVMFWPERVEYDARIEDGHVMLLSFARPLEADFSHVLWHLGPYIERIETVDEGRTLRIALRGSYDLRTSRLGNAVVVDILDVAPQPLLPETEEAQSAEAADQEMAAAPPGPTVATEMSGAADLPALPVTVAARPDYARVVFEWPEPVAYTAHQSGEVIEISFSRPARPRLAPLRVDPPAPIRNAEAQTTADGLTIRLLVAPGARLRHFRQEAAVVVDALAPPPSPAAAQAPAATQAPTETAQAPAPSRLAMGVETTGAGLRLVFPWPQEVAAAVFRRGGQLWVLFAAPAAIDLSALRDRDSGPLGAGQQIDHDEASVLRFPLAADTAVSAEHQGVTWQITVGEGSKRNGDALLEPVHVSRETEHPDGAALHVHGPQFGPTYRIVDPEMGDVLIVVPAVPERSGIAGRRDFVQFALLDSAQGVAIEPHSDDLIVESGPEGVRITAPGGLLLSDPAQRAERVEPALPAGLLPFTDDRIPPAELAAATRRLMRVAALAPAEGRTAARWELARVLLAHDLAAEAAGVLDLIAAEDADFARQDAFRAARGIARIRLGHIKEGLADLDSPALQLDPAMSLWRGLARAEMEDWSEAAAQFAQGEIAVSSFPPAYQARFRLAALRAALALREADQARRQLVAWPEDRLSPDLTAARLLAEGRLAELQGETKRALDLYARVIAAGHAPSEIEARYRQAWLMAVTGALDLDAAIARLDALRYAWRGDSLERAILASLGELHLRAGHPRAALEVMSDAVTHFPPTKPVRQIAARMEEVFGDLFLRGGADALPPIKALALYYDFRDLTPLGKDGDEMIRRLADRLVAVDLLDQAADLLDHQVTNRLSGVAQAQVATRLAGIRLLNGEPEAALDAIRRTRQTRLPAELADRRRMVEAQALAALGKHDVALELLAEAEGAEAAALRAELLWQAKRWGPAAAQIEALLGPRWQQEAALSDVERRQVLRAAIAYSLAEDRAAVGRLRQRYGALMARGPDAEAFAVVTGPINPEGVAFRDLASRIAELDTLKSFLERYRAPL